MRNPLLISKVEEDYQERVDPFDASGSDFKRKIQDIEFWSKLDRISSRRQASRRRPMAIVYPSPSARNNVSSNGSQLDFAIVLLFYDKIR